MPTGSYHTQLHVCWKGGERRGGEGWEGGGEGRGGEGRGRGGEGRGGVDTAKIC